MKSKEIIRKAIEAADSQRGFRKTARIKPFLLLSRVDKPASLGVLASAGCSQISWTNVAGKSLIVNLNKKSDRLKTSELEC
ncbi:hypothetical protein ACFQ4C_14810 [Larkinella insperata]|uniref:Uncharacterized protein n=1 Tax=Larkinella insperata TaxID=332158 RepID=A0ABW3QJI5_9BACT|nr:hypothetical protein [Larkinella insperata]